MTFSVIGIPRPAGSKRAFAFVRKGADGRPLMRQTKSGTAIAVLGTAVTDDSGLEGKAWRNAVAGAAVHAMVDAPPLEGALQVVLCFRMPRPKGHLKPDGQRRRSAPDWPITRPDIDKLSRAVLDALRGIVWRDDSQVVLKRALKLYAAGAPGVVVTVEPVPKLGSPASAFEAVTPNMGG